MQKKFTLASLSALACLSAHVGVAQDTASWRVYLEAGPKITQFRAMSYSGTEESLPQVRDTYSGFADVKAFKPLSNRVVLSGTVGVDMQLLNFKTGYTESFPAPGITSYSREHISRLLTRARLDWGIHYQFNLGESGHLMPGVSFGQMINLSKKGYSYSFIQPGLYYTTDRLLLSFTASDTPYNVLIPEASKFESTYRGRAISSESEFRVRELQLSVGAKF
ncbi:hypothetical protein [Hymenobacter glacieicola]|uniref:Outer membrane protein beta-barrel domain-containing protein n=1 Tax=Hymenobacter glacieicola TaxID=1562124 RepID=A0ABQ1WJE1_9BACT|nr:hypothetical protein [Hymenobacter glacieicola]GGG30584.1 hypothetical protein GCM10011378_04020 [Hymenobacter glacieicola]